ncbi:MAG TPA: hypothetical protein VJ997_06310 [Longimicrobiales bacterium]|nr:hypothetical protein [Longimicrobiales bacterium]
MTTRTPSSTVLLSDAATAPSLAADLAAASGPAACYSSVAELVKKHPLSSISILVLYFQALPKGILLAILGRMSVEYPAMQKVALLDEQPPLPIAEYLTHCGVNLLWDVATPEGRQQLASVVNHLHEGTPWIAS